jgi:hypothetical protein
MSELQFALSKCSKSSAGPDGIPFALIEHIPMRELPSLLKFYNYLWNTGFPAKWKHSILIATNTETEKNSKQYRLIQTYSPYKLFM